MDGKQQPPVGGNITNAIPGLVGVSFLFAITLIAYGVRMWTRIRPKFQLAAPDYTISAALVGGYRRYLVRDMLTFLEAVRNNRAHLFTDINTLRPRASRVLHLTGFSS